MDNNEASPSSRAGKRREQRSAGRGSGRGGRGARQGPQGQDGHPPGFHPPMGPPPPWIPAQHGWNQAPGLDPSTGVARPNAAYFHGAGYQTPGARQQMVVAHPVQAQQQVGMPQRQRQHGGRVPPGLGGQPGSHQHARLPVQQMQQTQQTQRMQPQWAGQNSLSHVVPARAWARTPANPDQTVAHPVNNSPMPDDMDYIVTADITASEWIRLNRDREARRLAGAAPARLPIQPQPRAQAQLPAPAPYPLTNSRDLEHYLDGARPAGQQYQGMIANLEHARQLGEAFESLGNFTPLPEALGNGPPQDEEQVRQLIRQLREAILNWEDIVDKPRAQRQKKVKKTKQGGRKGGAKKRKLEGGEAAEGEEEPAQEEEQADADPDDDDEYEVKFVDNSQTARIKRLTDLEIEMICWKIWEALLEVHRGHLGISPWSERQRYCGKISKDYGLDKKLKFMERFKAVVANLRRSKATTANLISSSFLRRLVAHPIREIVRKAQNKKQNTQRDAQVKAGNYAIQQRYLQADAEGIVRDRDGREVAPGDPKGKEFGATVGQLVSKSGRRSSKLRRASSAATAVASTEAEQPEGGGGHQAVDDDNQEVDEDQDVDQDEDEDQDDEDQDDEEEDDDDDEAEEDSDDGEGSLGPELGESPAAFLEPDNLVDQELARSSQAQAQAQAEAVVGHSGAMGFSSNQLDLDRPLSPFSQAPPQGNPSVAPAADAQQWLPHNDPQGQMTHPQQHANIFGGNHPQQHANIFEGDNYPNQFVNPPDVMGPPTLFTSHGDVPGFVLQTQGMAPNQPDMEDMMHPQEQPYDAPSPTDYFNHDNEVYYEDPFMQDPGLAQQQQWHPPQHHMAPPPPYEAYENDMMPAIGQDEALQPVVVNHGPGPNHGPVPNPEEHPEEDDRRPSWVTTDASDETVNQQSSSQGGV